MGTLLYDRCERLAIRIMRLSKYLREDPAAETMAHIVSKYGTEIPVEVIVEKTPEPTPVPVAPEGYFFSNNMMIYVMAGCVALAIIFIVLLAVCISRGAKLRKMRRDRREELMHERSEAEDDFVIPGEESVIAAEETPAETETPAEEPAPEIFAEEAAQPAEPTEQEEKEETETSAVPPRASARKKRHKPAH